MYLCSNKIEAFKMYVPIGQRGEFRLVLLTFRDVNTSLGLGIVYSAHNILSRLLFRYHCQYFTATFAASTLRYTNVLEAFVKGCDARYLPVMIDPSHSLVSLNVSLPLCFSRCYRVLYSSKRFDNTQC